MQELQRNNIHTISSREVAEMMEKSHKHLLEKIDKINETFNSRKIGSSKYWTESTYKQVGNGKENREYQVTKLGCEFLAHKSTGEKGIVFTARYMDKFEEMEKSLQQNTPSYMIEDPVKRAEKWIEEYKEKQLLEVQNDKLNKEIDHKENVIIGLVDDISLAEKRARIKQVINHNANGRYAERYNLLYKEFQDKYHIDLKRRMDNLELKSIVTNYLGEDVKITKKIKTNKMEYIDKILCKTPELYEIVCKLFENDIEELMKEWESTII